MATTEEEISGFLYGSGDNKLYVESIFLLHKDDIYDGVDIFRTLHTGLENDPSIKRVDIVIDFDGDLDRWQDRDEMEEHSLWLIPERTLKRYRTRLFDLLSGWKGVPEDLLIIVLRDGSTNDASVNNWISTITKKVDLPVMQVALGPMMIGPVCQHLLGFDPSHGPGRNAISRFHS